MSNITLENELTEVDEQISKLCNRRQQLVKEIKDTEIRSILSNYDEYSLTENMCLILFANATLEYCPVRTYIINTIDRERMSISCVSGSYKYYEYEYEFHVKLETLTFSQFLDLSKHYNIYQVSESKFKDFLNDLCNLDLTVFNFKKQESCIHESCVKKIS